MRWRVGLACVLVAFAAATAAAAPFAARGMRALSSRSPFRHGCGVPGQRTPNSVGEPSIAVNPRNPRNIITVWQQDRFVVDGGALSNLVAVTKDAGRTWRRVRLPRLSRCTGGHDERASDPWVSIGPDGTAYLSSLTFVEHPALVGLAGPTAQRVSRSTDGGVTWSRPVTIVDDGMYNDRGAVTADPRRRGVAYHVWVRRLGILGEQGFELFSRTTDGGRRWSKPRAITQLRAGTLPDPSVIRVLPDGSLLDVYVLANETPFLPASVPRVPWLVTAQRSRNGGRTWSRPVQIAAIQPPSAPSDPDTGALVRAYNEVSVDVAPDGAAYVAWNVIRSPRSSQILVSRSTDRGRRWSAPRAVARPPTQAFLPELAVARDGTVGVIWDDFRHDRRGDGRLTTDVWFASSRDRGRSWRRTHVAGPFDVLTASPTDSTAVAGRFLGDYQGLAALPTGFVAAFAQGRPRAIHGGTDLFFARIAAR